MDSSRSLTYGLPILGVVILSVSLGGVVLGAYASIQEDTGHCGNPLIHVTPPDKIGPLSGQGGEGLTYPVIDFQELSLAEQRGFEEALARVDHVGTVDATLVHHSEIENGAIVLYQGERYYVTLHGENACVGMDPLVLPLGVLGSIIGVGLVVAPSLWKRLGGPGSQDLGRTVADPRIVMFDGLYADFWMFIVFTIGVTLGLLHWIGLFIGAVLIGFVSSTSERAIVLGVYLSCLVALLFTVYDVVISALIGVPSSYPAALFSPVYPSFITAIPLAVLVSVVVRASIPTPTDETTQ
jgi:hypothetical protein